MHKHRDGGSDLVVSLDAFKISHHPGARHPWHVAALVPWAQVMMNLHAREHGEPTHGSGVEVEFPRRKDAMRYVAECNALGSDWRYRWSIARKRGR
jgi:hypothetical protein